MRKTFAFLPLAALLSACAGTPATMAPQPAKPIDAATFYTGTWYEIGRTPVSVTTNCMAGTTEFYRLPDTQLMERDACHKGSPEGKERVFRGSPVPPVQGIVTAVVANKLTIKTDAGDSYDVTVTDTTRIMENRQPIKLTDIKPGDSVMAMGQVDATAKTVQAVMVNATDAATVAKAKENMGKTYITGKITAIDVDNLKLTVMRTDNVSQVIAVDDGTSFQRGMRGVAADVTAAGGIAMGGGFGGGRGMGGGRPNGAAQGAPPAPESITLADIKVGDSIMATGAIKGGAFTALKMGISAPGGPGRRAMQGQSMPQGSVPQGQVATPQ